MGVKCGLSEGEPGIGSSFKFPEFLECRTSLEPVLNMPHRGPPEPVVKGYLLWESCLEVCPGCFLPFHSPSLCWDSGEGTRTSCTPKCVHPWVLAVDRARVYGTPGAMLGSFERLVEIDLFFIWPGRVGEVVKVHPKMDLEAICKSSLGCFCYYYFLTVHSFVQSVSVWARV